MTSITVVDGADGLTPDMLRQRTPLRQPPLQGEIVMSALPVTFRGSAMESHSGWPRTWTGRTPTQVGIVAEQIGRLVHRSAFPQAFTVTVQDLTITVDRNLGW